MKPVWHYFCMDHRWNSAQQPSWRQKKEAFVERFLKIRVNVWTVRLNSGRCRAVALSRCSIVFVFQNFINRDLKILLDPGLNLLGLRVETCWESVELVRPQGKFPLIKNNGSVKSSKWILCISSLIQYHNSFK